MKSDTIIIVTENEERTVPDGFGFTFSFDIIEGKSKASSTSTALSKCWHLFKNEVTCALCIYLFDLWERK